MTSQACDIGATPRPWSHHKSVPSGAMRLALAVLAFLPATAALASPLGEWVVKDKSARVAIKECGPNLCGALSWTTDGQDLGDPILIDMKPDGERWTGTVVDVRNGRKYLAHIHLQSADALRLDGCVLGGLICDGEVWTRYDAPAPASAPPPRRKAANK
jgi:uncharacterized protein (DUF2147 family)